MNFEMSWDVAIIGGGPAGISAGIWSHRLGLKAILLESQDVIGGQLNAITGVVSDYPGFIFSKGFEFVPHLKEHILALKLPVIYNVYVNQIDEFKKKLYLNTGQSLSAKNIVLAMGASKKHLGVDGEAFFYGKGLGYSPTKEIALLNNATIAIVGGGDGAVENAIMMSSICRKIFLIHHRSTLNCRKDFEREVYKIKNIQICLDNTVSAVIGKEQVEAIEVQNKEEKIIYKVDKVFIKIGMKPNTEILSNSFKKDAKGYLCVDSRQETSVKNIFAVGDICNPEFSSIAVSVGHGAIVAKIIKKSLL